MNNDSNRYCYYYYYYYFYYYKSVRISSKSIGLLMFEDFVGDFFALTDDDDDDDDDFTD